MSSSDEIAVFQAYTSLITSEHETLWARHNALLLANSLIIGALAISPAALWQNKWAALAMLSAGLLISAAWIGMAMLAWSTIRRYADLAGSFASASFKHLPNPFAETICNRARKRMHLLVLLMIAVFMLMYIVLALLRLASA
ncbi:MAG TPA: hypothetical protein VHK26_13415 [Methyloceanibacter sp.]|nr:hypothetical protein [Methyloceanibacter sp.]